MFKMKPRVLIKIGGQAFEDEGGFKELATAIKYNPETEIIIVHGGGAEISQALKDANRETVFIDGTRVTQAEDIKIVENILSGTINQRIAFWLTKNGVPCRRMSGKTKHLFTVEPLTRKGQDLGYVGKITQVNAGIVLDTLKDGRVPVVSPISANDEGESHNVNADSAAAALAADAQCTDLAFITDVPGVLIDEQICRSLTIYEAKTLIAEGTISGGMVAKMESTFEALEKKVPRVHITQWQGPDTLQSIIEGECKNGTIIQTHDL
jgi:acetylglutamate kinase|tara:strand:+ start:53791 stop:54588 length:798 start_codon:yes stop_codon:yes gene_type:complete